MELFDVSDHAADSAATVTVWVLCLSRPETLVLGPYLTEEAAVAAGRGRLSVQHPKVQAGCIQVLDGLVCRLDGVPTLSLREEFASYLAHGNPLLKNDGSGEPYSDAELDRRRPSAAAVEARLAPGRRLCGL